MEKEQIKEFASQLEKTGLSFERALDYATTMIQNKGYEKFIKTMRQVFIGKEAK